MNNHSGIYMIRTPTSKLYIGSAINFRNRWNTHKSQLSNNKHSNKILQREWNKYGAEGFEFSILEYVNEKAQLLDKEQEWLDDLFTYLDVGTVCNHLRISSSALGFKHSDEAKKNMSQAQRNRIRNYGNTVALTKSGGKLYNFVSPCGDVFHNVVSLRAFAKQHGLNHQGLGCLASGKYKQYKGWICQAP